MQSFVGTQKNRFNETFFLCIQTHIFVRLWPRVRLEENNNCMIQYYLQQNSFLSAKYTLISNYYKNRRRLKHM